MELDTFQWYGGSSSTCNCSFKFCAKDYESRHVEMAEVEVNGLPCKIETINDTTATCWLPEGAGLSRLYVKLPSTSPTLWGKC